MKLKYRDTAIDDILKMGFYIAERLSNRSAAENLRMAITKNVLLLKQAPYMGTPLVSIHPEIEAELRYLVVNKRMVFYEVNGELVEIIRVLDGRTDYMAELFGGAED